MMFSRVLPAESYSVIIGILMITISREEYGLHTHTSHITHTHTHTHIHTPHTHHIHITSDHTHTHIHTYHTPHRNTHESVALPLPQNSRLTVYIA